MPPRLAPSAGAHVLMAWVDAAGDLGPGSEYGPVAAVMLGATGETSPPATLQAFSARTPAAAANRRGDAVLAWSGGGYGMPSVIRAVSTDAA